MTKYEQYTISQRAFEILNKEGYVFLLLTDNKKIETWETTKILNDQLPLGAEHIIEASKIKKYGNIIFIDQEN